MSQNNESQILICEEDVETASKMANETLGPIGRMVYPVTKDVITDAKVFTKEHGTLWYGDLERSDLNKLVVLQSKLGYAVSVEE